MGREDEDRKVIEPIVQDVSEEKLKKEYPLKNTESVDRSAELSLEELITQVTKERDAAYEKLTKLQTFWSFGNNLLSIVNFKDNWLDTGNSEFDKLNHQINLLIAERERLKKAEIEAKGESVAVFPPFIDRGVKFGIYAYQFLTKNNELSADNLSIIEREELEVETTTMFLKLIEHGDVIQYIMPAVTQYLLPVVTQYSFPQKKDVILLPDLSIIRDTIINLVIPNITNSPDIFKGVEKNVVKDLTAFSLNLLSILLKGEELNVATREIIKSFRSPTNNSMPNLIKNISVILSAPKVAEIIKNDLSVLLDNTENHQELAKIIRNYLASTLVVPSKLLDNTVSLMAHNSSVMMSSLPELLKTYSHYLDYQKLEVSSLSDVEKDDEEQIKNFLTHAQKSLTLLSPILKSDLLGYLNNNKKDILKLLNPEIENNIKPNSSSLNLISKGAEATMSFVIDALPVMVDLGEESLKNLALSQKIIKHVTDLMNSSEGEYPTKISEMVNLLTELGDTNPKIKENFFEKLVPLLEKKFTPIIEELCQEIQGARINAEEIIKVLGGNKKLLKEIVRVAEKYPKFTFMQDVLPLVGLILTDMKALKLVIGACGNLLSYSVDKYLVPNIIRDKFISRNINKIIEDISQNPRTEKDEAGRYDLAKEFQAKIQEISTAIDALPSSTFVYSLNHRDLQGLLLERKLDNFKIDNFNFDEGKFKVLSCENSQLIKCSFNNVSFPKNMSFKGATIDEVTLLTLIPAIEKHIKNNPKNVLNLEGINFNTVVDQLLQERWVKLVASQLPPAPPPRALKESHIDRILHKERERRPSKNI